MKRKRNSLFFPVGSLRAQFVLCALLMCPLGHADDIVAGNFELIDQQGRAVTEHSFDGKLRLVFFGYTSCPDVCPTTLFEVARVMRQLGDEARQVQPIFISVDPETDTPERLASYVAAIHPSLLGLTGTKQQLDAAAAAFNVTYGIERPSGSDSGPGTVYHSSYLFLMDRQGAFLDVFGYGSNAEVIEGRLREHF
jgi:protein SCO1/2